MQLMPRRSTHLTSRTTTEAAEIPSLHASYSARFERMALTHTSQEVCESKRAGQWRTGSLLISGLQ